MWGHSKAFFWGGLMRKAPTRMEFTKHWIIASNITFSRKKVCSQIWSKNEVNFGGGLCSGSWNWEMLAFQPLVTGNSPDNFGPPDLTFPAIPGSSEASRMRTVPLCSTSIPLGSQTFAYLYAYVYIYIYIYIHTHIYIYMHMHSYMQL